MQPRLSPALMPLWRAVHARLSTGRPVTKVRVGPLDPEQRSAIADLLGAERLPGTHLDITLSKLDDVLREILDQDSREVVTRLIGPVGDRAAERRRAEAERAGLWDWLVNHPVVAAQPALADWATGVRRAGLVDASASKTRNELHRVLQVLAELPATGLPLPAFADAVLGDTHSLDDGRRCANLVLKALAAIYEVPVPIDAAGRRALWEQAGVADDALSSTVLVAGLRAGAAGSVGEVLRVCAEAGQAAVLTLQQLRTATEWEAVPEQVWIFENPSVLSVALERFGTRCPPLVCTSGWPSSAGILLLKRLRDAGSALRYHGDFDGEGLRIAAHVVVRTGATPWRMTCEDYLAAVADGPPPGRVTEVPWDAGLATALERAGVTVPEERLAGPLLEEIGNWTKGGRSTR